MLNKTKERQEWNGQANSISGFDTFKLENLFAGLELVLEDFPLKQTYEEF